VQIKPIAIIDTILQNIFESFIFNVVLIIPF